MRSGTRGPLPPIPDFFRILVTLLGAGFGGIPVLKGPELSLAPWFAFIEPFVLGAFSLVVGEVWYGLLSLKLGRDVGLLERAVQEQIASIFHRFAAEKVAKFVYELRGAARQSTTEEAIGGDARESLGMAILPLQNEV